MTDYAAVLIANYAGTQWSLTGNDYDTLDWYSDSAKPTQAELDAQWPTVDYQNQYNTVETTRRTQYEQQSDGIYFAWQRGEAKEIEWRKAVAKVKADNPYPPVRRTT